MKVSYIVTTYNKKELLKQIIEERLTRLKAGDELIVMDDGSTDGTKELIKQYPAVRYGWQKNKGYRVASLRNKGIAMAKNNCIIQSDDDCLFPDGYVEMLLKHYGKDTLISGAFEREKRLGGRDPDWRTKHLGVYKKLGKNLYELVDKGFSGPVCYDKKFALMIKKYDSDFDGNWGGEDTNFGQRWNFSGGKTLYVNEIVCTHLYHTPRETYKAEQRKNWGLMERKLRDFYSDENIAVIIHTFLRDEALNRCINSVKKHIKNYRLYISDAGFMTDEKEKLYKELECQGHKIVLLFHDTNWTVGRNELVKLVEEKYIFYLDDDFVITEDTNIDLLKGQLKGKVGVAGSAIRIRGKILEYNFQVEGKPGDIKYVPSNGHVDVIANCFLAKKEVFSEDRWDKNLNVGSGHSDFFLNLKFKTDWKVVFCPECIVDHLHIGSSEYHDKRKRTGWHTKFLEKWNSGNALPRTVKSISPKKKVGVVGERTLVISERKG